MGRTPDKTFVAPDGSVYRIEADGSVTKIKSGSVGMKEPPSNYKVVSDGKIFRIEKDGSVSFLGNVEDLSNTTRPAGTPRVLSIPPPLPPIGSNHTPPLPPINRNSRGKKSNDKWIWITLIIYLAIGLGLLIYMIGIAYL